MRMAIHPGRGGRGLMPHRKPRYLMMNPPDLPFGNRKIVDLGNPYGVLRMQYSDCEMTPNYAEETEITKDTLLSDEQIHMVKIPDSVINCDRRSGALQSSIKKRI